MRGAPMSIWWRVLEGSILRNIDVVAAWSLRMRLRSTQRHGLFSRSSARSISLVSSTTWIIVQAADNLGRGW